MGRLKEIHDAGINRSAERWCPHHAAHRGSLNVPALPAGSRVERNALTPLRGTRSSRQRRGPGKSLRIQQHRQVQAGRKSHIGHTPCARTLGVVHVRTALPMVAATSRCVSPPSAQKNRPSGNRPEVHASIPASSALVVSLDTTSSLAARTWTQVQWNDVGFGHRPVCNTKDPLSAGPKCEWIVLAGFAELDLRPTTSRRISALPRP